MIAYTTPALVYARAALARGPLVEHRVMHGGRGVFWRHRRRLFASATVNILIANGEAVRVGENVMSVAEAVRRTPRPAPPVTTPAGGATIIIGAELRAAIRKIEGR